MTLMGSIHSVGGRNEQSERMACRGPVIHALPAYCFLLPSARQGQGRNLKCVREHSGKITLCTENEVGPVVGVLREGSLRTHPRSARGFVKGNLG